MSEITTDTIIVESGEEFRSVVLGRPNWDKLVLNSGARANICVILFPGQDADIPISVELVGPDAKVELSGVYLCGRSEQVSFNTDVRHLCPSCVSIQDFNGVAAGTSRVKFSGRIVVAQDAQKTEAFQTNHNIVLSGEAKVDTKPQLEIYADDVKCSHGATVGSLNADEQFYMCSRGIPEDEAKVLQLISFVAPVPNHIEDEGQRSELLEKIEKSIREIV